MIQLARPLFAARKARLNPRVPEWKLQAAVVAEFHRLQEQGWDFEFAGDGGGLRLSRSQAGIAKITGCMEGGEPDFRLYLKPGRTVFLEFKAKGGRLSPRQIARHRRLEALGFEVRVIQADTELDAVRASKAILKMSLN
jgi:hypothetical protein